MEQSPLEKPMITQDILRLSWNTRVHSRVHKNPLLDPILSQINPLHAHQSHFFKTHFSTTFASMPRFPKWAFSLNGSLHLFRNKPQVDSGKTGAGGTFCFGRHFTFIIIINCLHGSVGIATSYGFDSWQCNISLFSTASKPTPWSTQPPIQCVPRVLSPG
jgi:hypothetical protein